MKSDQDVSVDSLNCVVCGSGQFSRLPGLDDEEYQVLVCNRCRLGRTHPIPDVEQLVELYSDAYYGRAGGGKFRPALEVLVRLVGGVTARRLTRTLPRGSRVLDFGCGRGVMLRAFADRGFEVHGVEVSERAACGADARAAIYIAERLSDLRFPDGFFDLIVIWHVLEHLVDPRITLTEARRILKPGARVAIAVPNFSSLQARWAGADWFHLDLPRHLHHFPLGALTALVGDCGFRCLEVRHFSLRQNPFGWIQSALNRIGWISNNDLYKMLQGVEAAAGGSTMKRLLLALAFCAGMPFALVLSGCAAFFKSGATVCVVAEKAD